MLKHQRPWLDILAQSRPPQRSASFRSLQSPFWIPNGPPAGQPWVTRSPALTLQERGAEAGGPWGPFHRNRMPDAGAGGTGGGRLVLRDPAPPMEREEKPAGTSSSKGRNYGPSSPGCCGKEATQVHKGLSQCPTPRAQLRSVGPCPLPSPGTHARCSLAQE